jgi:serine/threonine protein kinase
VNFFDEVRRRKADADFIVMEYVRGKTLDQLISRRGLRLNELLSYAIQTADALSKAHTAGVVHRDLKPGAIMVTEEGRVKALDFGMAKLTELARRAKTKRRALSSRTEDGAVVGTIAYMSPEQAEGKPVDARSDIFSFGAVLYELATGARAFQGSTKLSTLSAILRQNPKLLASWLPAFRVTWTRSSHAACAKIRRAVFRT